MVVTNKYISRLKDTIGNERMMFTSRDVSSAGISRTELSRLEKEGLVFRVRRGIYSFEKDIEDPFYNMSERFRSGVFCRRTALYLHGLLNRAIDTYEMHFPQRYNVANAKSCGVVAYNRAGIRYSLGIHGATTPFGNDVRCYDKERAICEMFIYEICDYEEMKYAMNQYMNSKDANIDKLFVYADRLKVREKVETAVMMTI